MLMHLNSCLAQLRKLYNIVIMFYYTKLALCNNFIAVQLIVNNRNIITSCYVRIQLLYMIELKQIRIDCR